MVSYWQGLAANLALMALVILLWSYIEDQMEERPAWQRSISIGGVLACGVVAIMAVPVVLTPGVVFDLRVVCVTVATFYGGPLAGGIVAAAALVYRALLGGAGIWAGIAGIALSYCAACLIGMVVRDRNIGLPSMGVLGVAAATANLAGLLILPHALLVSTLRHMALPATCFSIAGTVFAGLILRQEARRRALARSNRVFRSLVEALPDCLNVKDRQGRFLAANTATAKLMGAPSSEALIGHTDFDFYPRETAGRLEDDELAVWERGEPLRIEQTLERADGSKLVLSTLKAPLRDPAGGIIGLITHNSDITERKRLASQLVQANEHLDLALANMADGLVMFDARGRIVMCNQRYRDLFPKTGADRVAGADIGAIIRRSVELGEERVADAQHLESILADNCAFVRRSGTNLIPVGDGRWIESRTRQLADGNALTVLSDVTERKRAEEALALANRELQDLATTDSLTGLANRRRFDEVIARAFAQSARDQSWLGLLIADVDRFKDYNDMYGHLAGDEGLRVISRLLEGSVRRPLDTPARFGGEEFAAILPNTDAAGVAHIAEIFRRRVEEAALKHARSNSGCLTVSVGVAAVVAGRTASDPREVIARADTALYEAKSAGRNRVQAADDGIRGLENTLRRMGS